METVTSIAPQLQTGCAQPYVAIPVATPYQWSNMELIISDLTRWLSSNGIKIAGPLFYRYRTFHGSYDAFDAEVGYPVAAAAFADGRIVTGSIPEGTFATLTHCGQPGALGPSFEVMQNWANQQGIQWQYEQHNGKQVWTGCFEFYLTHPADVTDKSKCRMALAILTAT